MKRNKRTIKVIVSCIIATMLMQTGFAMAEDSTSQSATEPSTGQSATEPSTSAEEPAVEQEDETTIEYEQQADSWRYSDGLIKDEANTSPRLKSRAAFTPWSKVNGNYISSNGSVIKGAVRKGIDVSSWQGDIDWAKVKASGINFAIIRCGYGSNITSQDDSKWLRNVTECERLGIPYGVYLYSYANTVAKAKSEAQHTLRLLKGHHPSYPVYYDLEDKVVSAAGNSTITNIANTYCSAIEAGGYKAGIYANLSWWNSKLTSSTLNKYDKWVAQWNSSCTYTGNYRLWQSTSNGSVPGISGRVDLNFEFSAGRWIADGVGYKYEKRDGTYYTNGLATIDGCVYYFNAEGYRLTGFQEINGNRYYFQSNGAASKGWTNLGGNKYYARNNGTLYKGLNYIGKYRYYFDPETGVMQKGFRDIGGNRYYFQSNGAASRGWANLGGNKYYARNNGTLYKGLNYIGKYRYYFDPETGVMQKGFRDIGGNRYYFQSNGAASRGWANLSGNKYYARNNGTLYKGWHYVGKYKYYFDPNTCIMQKGTKVIDGKTYKFDKNGRLK